MRLEKIHSGKLNISKPKRITSNVYMTKICKLFILLIGLQLTFFFFLEKLHLVFFRNAFLKHCTCNNNNFTKLVTMSA